MALWIPITLIAVTVAAVYSQRKSASTATAACANQFTPEQRANLDRFLQTDPRDLLALAASKGFDKSQAVNEMHLNATKLDALGCEDDATRVRAKAAEVSLATLRPTDTRHGPTNQGTPPPPAQPISGAFVAPEVRVGGMETPSAPTQHGVAPGTTQRLDQAYGQAFGAPPASPPPPSQPVVAVTRTNARVAIRPEPVAWNDEAMGKLGFTVPAGYPVGITAVGPPTCPPGWTKVAVRHPDEEGSVEGFTEAANLVPPQQANPSQQAKAPQQAKPAPSTSGMPQSFQGRSRTRTQQQRAKVKAARSTPKASTPAR